MFILFILDPLSLVLARLFTSFLLDHQKHPSFFRDYLRSSFRELIFILGHSLISDFVLGVQCPHILVFLALGMQCPNILVFLFSRAYNALIFMYFFSSVQ